jgi:hypothetical protein
VTTLKILAIIVPAALVFWMVSRFDGYAYRRFHHRFFTLRTCFASLGILLLMVHGTLLCFAAQSSHADPLNGVLVIGLALTAAAAMLVRNIRRTSLGLGVLGSVLQTVLAPVAAIMLVVLLLACGLATPPQPVCVVNR